jgi:hypothetical protein
MNETNPTNGTASTTLEPTVGSCYSHGWGVLWKNFLELLLVFIVILIASIPMGWMSAAEEMGHYEGFLLFFFAIVYGIMILAPLEYGLPYVALKAARGDKVEVKDILEPFKNYFNAVLANLLMDIVIVIGLIFFIIPGIYFAVKLAFVPYLVVDQKLDAIEAFKGSWRMTDGFGAEIFLIGLLSIPIYIAGFLLLGVGIIVSTLWVSTAFASIYHAAVTKRKTAELVAGQ